MTSTFRHARLGFVLGLSLAVSAAAVACRAPAPAPAPAPQGFDLLISGGRIVDGTGAPWFVGDVAVTGDRIVAVGQLKGAPARQTIDATGLVVAPGFIDMLGQSEFNVLVDGRAASKITQGITTEITGEGNSIGPVNDRMVADAAASYKHFNVAQDFRTLGRVLHAARDAEPADSQPRVDGGRGWRARLRHRPRRPPRDPG